MVFNLIYFDFFIGGLVCRCIGESLRYLGCDNGSLPSLS